MLSKIYIGTITKSKSLSHIFRQPLVIGIKCNQFEKKSILSYTLVQLQCSH